MRLTEVRQTLPSTVFIVAWLSTFVVSSYARGLIAQTPGVLDSAQLAAIWNSKYTRVLQIFRLVSVRPALDGACPNER